MTIHKHRGFCLDHDSLRNKAHPQTPAATRDHEFRAGPLHGEDMLVTITSIRGEKNRPRRVSGEHAGSSRICPILGPKLKHVLQYHRHRRQSRNSLPPFHDSNQHIVSHGEPSSIFANRGRSHRLMRVSAFSLFLVNQEWSCRFARYDRIVVLPETDPQASDLHTNAVTSPQKDCKLQRGDTIEPGAAQSYSLRRQTR